MKKYMLAGMFWVGLIFTLIVPVVVGIYFENKSASWLAALCGAFITLTAKIDSLSELSLGPVKAKMKETIAEANATIEQLREIAASVTGATLTEMMAGRFLGGVSLGRSLDIHDSLIQLLQGIGIAPEKISQAEDDWRKGVSIIYLNAIKHEVERCDETHHSNPDATEDEKAAVNELQELFEYETWTVPRPERIRKVLSDHSIENHMAFQWINDYANFLNNNEIRRRDEFVKQ